MEHVRKDCMVRECADEASYWIDTSIIDAAHTQNDTFYLCVDHMGMLQNDETGNYYHLDIATGELFDIEFGGYACDPECEVCND
jgi:hypothetical protein